MSNESPFARAAVMRGYPLDQIEKAALEHALHEVEHFRANGSNPDALASSEPRQSPPRDAAHT
jgi:hypothetical protein